MPEGERGMIAGLTVRQPWAGLIGAGVKPYENRSGVPALDQGTYLAIQASRRPSRSRCGDDWDAAAAVYARHVAGGGKRVSWMDQYVALTAGGRATAASIDLAMSMPHGAITAVAVYRGAVRPDGCRPSPWLSGPFGWVLTDPVLIDPIPHKGRLWVWPVEGELLDRLKAAYDAAGGKRFRGRV